MTEDMTRRRHKLTVIRSQSEDAESEDRLDGCICTAGIEQRPESLVGMEMVGAAGDRALASVRGLE